MKKYILLALGLLAAPVMARAGSVTFGSDSIRVSVSTTAASPTLILAADRTAKVTCIANWNSGAGQYVMLGDSSTSFSTSSSTGTFRLGPNSSICLDGADSSYTGAVYGVSLDSAALVVDAVRIR